MAFQMVYTSVRSGLVAGRSGFCTAARHREIKESLVARLEDFSAQYDRGIAAGGTLPVVYQHRIVTIRDQRHHVLMRLGDAGNDYTGRTNHIAHCLAVEPSEIAELSLSPAEAILALSQRGFWRSHYDEPARFFGVGDTVDLGSLSRSASLPAARWRECTGSSANAAQLFDSGAPMDTGIALAGTGEADAAGILALFAESLLLLDPGRSSGAALWSVPFTTVLQSSAERSQFRWCGIVADSGPAAQEVRAGRRILSPGSAMNPPSSALADIAEGRAPRVEPVAVAAWEMPPVGNAPTAAGPGEMAGVRTSAAGQEPEPADYAVPLSLEDPRRRQRSAEARRNPARIALLCAAAVLLMVAMAGGFVFWSGNKEVWEEEKRIGEMVEGENWKDISDRFIVDDKAKEILERSTKLQAWEKAATAINGYQKLKTNPQNHTEDFGTVKIDEALIRIEKWEPTGEAVDSKTAERIKQEKAEAENSVKFWNRTIDTIARYFKSVSALTESQNSAETTQIRNELAKTTSEIAESKLSPEAGDQLKGPLLFLEDNILAAIDGYSEIRFEHESEETFTEARMRAEKISEGLRAAIKDLESEQPRESKELGGIYVEAINAYEGILKYEEKIKLKPTSLAPQKRVPPKPDPSVIAAAEAKKEKIPPKTILVRSGSDGLIDLSGIDGAPRALPSEFEILPVSALASGDGGTGHLVTLVGDVTYYDKKKTVVIFRKSGSSKLKKEGSADFWKPFPCGYLIRLPKSTEGADEVRYLVLDANIPENQGSTKTVALAAKRRETFLKLGAPGEVVLSESVAAILKRITPAAGDPTKYPLKYRLTLAGDFPVASEWVGDPSAITLRVSVTIQERLAGIQDSKKLKKSAEEARKSVESRYSNLGRDLFPQFFEKEAPNEVASKVDKKNPAGGLPPVVLGTFPDFAKGAPLQFSRLPEYIEYVKSLFASLEALSEGSAQYNSAHQHIEKYIEKASQSQPVDGLPKEAVAWYELTRAWSASPGSNPPASTSDGKAKQTDRDAEQIQRKYFDDFFRVWNERFSETAVKKLIDDLNLIQATQALPSPEQLDSTLKTLEATKSRLENNDLTDDGEYTLELMLETPNPASSGIPLIRGTR